MKLQIGAPEAWHGAVVQARRRDGRGDLGEAILRLCHSSGLGVPVSTAFGFAGWLSGGAKASVAWDGLFPVALLRQEGWSISNVVSRLALCPFDATRLLLFPVAARVQAELGAAQLFAEVEGGGPLDAKLAARFEARLNKVLQTQLRSKVQAERAELTAWRHSIAVRCLQFLRQVEAGPVPWTDPDAVSAELFLGAARLLDNDPSRQLAQPRPILAKTRVSHRFQSNGIEGIRHASPSEDPSAMLPSQMIYPASIMAERIANEGFMAYDRPPHLPDRQRYLIGVLAHVTQEMLALSVARAAFWTAARSIEADLCRDLGSLTFCWIPIGRKARLSSCVLHEPRPGARMAHDHTALAWTQRFDGIGAPFLAGSRPPALADAQAPLWPEDVIQTLRDVGLSVDTVHTDPLHLHLSVVTDMPVEDAMNCRAVLDRSTASFKPASRGTAWMQLGEAPDSIASDLAEPMGISGNFSEDCHVVRNLADLWQRSIQDVLRHG